MPLNISRGNMYPFVDATFNIIKGKCLHDCTYCYMKIFRQNPVRLDGNEFKTNLLNGNYIFVGSSTDMWADNIPDEWISKTLGYCSTFGNKYLFQTKNPKRFNDFMYYIPQRSILACTIETNRMGSKYDVSKAPSVVERLNIMANLKYPKMVSIEPIMDFDLVEMTSWIKTIKPDFISIGADSKNHHLPEPSPENLELLINNLKGITKVIIKDNLKRLRQEFPKVGK